MSRKKNGHDCTKIKCLKIGIIKKRKKTVKIVTLNLSMFLNENQSLKYSDDSCQRKLSLKVQFNHILGPGIMSIHKILNWSK